MHKENNRQKNESIPFIFTPVPHFNLIYSNMSMTESMFNNNWLVLCLLANVHCPVLGNTRDYAKSVLSLIKQLQIALEIRYVSSLQVLVAPP